MRSVLPPVPARLLGFASSLVILCGASGILVGALAPWATFRIFHNIEINLPGFVFTGGSLCLAITTIVFLVGRRLPLFCVIGALIIFSLVHKARTEVPDRIQRQLVGAQVSLLPVNRLLDQFHINDAGGGWPIEVADFQAQRANLLGTGLGWTNTGALALLLGSVLGLPSDPVAVWVYTHTVRARCRLCGMRWLLARPVQFCPHCGTSTRPVQSRNCPLCRQPARRGDRYCVACGTTIPSSESTSELP